MGWATSTGIVSNCLMAGGMNISSEGGDIICRNNSRAIILDTYYLTDWNTGQATEAISTNAYDMACGKLCCQLNAGRSEERQAWFQTLDEDRYPVPDNRHLPVWYYEDAYVNESPDGLKEMHNSQIPNHNTGTIYDLSGRIVQSSMFNVQLRKGIYIKDGKKNVYGPDGHEMRH